MAGDRGLQLDMFGGVDESATVGTAAPMMAAGGGWQMAETAAFATALRRGSLNDALGVLNRLKIDTAWKVLLEAGFTAGSSTDRKTLMAPVQNDIIEAAQRGLTGRELRTVRIQEENSRQIRESLAGADKLVDTEGSLPVHDGVRQVELFIPDARMGEFQHKLKSIQAMALKLGLLEWEVTLGAKEWRKVNVLRSGFDGNPTNEPMGMEGTPVSIVGKAPVIAGWRFLAKVEHSTDGNIIKSMASIDQISKSWHSCAPNCEHCDSNRQRKNTFMLQSVLSGEVKQVGSSCVSDFVGEQYRDPERIAALFSYLDELSHEYLFDPDKEVGDLGQDNLGVSPERIMAATLKIVEMDRGYISAEKSAVELVLSTADQVKGAFWGRNPNDVVRYETGHLERAKEVVGWLKGQTDSDSLWMRNIAHLAGRENITMKNASLFASGFVAWNRELERKLRGERGAGEWIGQPGEKTAVAAILERQGGFETQFGYKSILTFRDEVGNALVWKTSSPPEGVQVGALYHIQATIKEHGEFKGDKQTEITRAKLAELELFNFGSIKAYGQLAKMATLDVPDNSGMTPLVYAVAQEKPDHVRALLSAGADANQRFGQEKMPVLAYAHTAEMAGLLMASGARATDIDDAALAFMEAPAREAIKVALEKVTLSVDDSAIDQPIPPIPTQPAVEQGGNEEGEVIRRMKARWAAVKAISGSYIKANYEQAGITFVGEGKDRSIVKDGVVVGVMSGRVSRQALHDTLIQGIQEDAAFVAQTLEKEYQHLLVPAGYKFRFEPKDAIRAIETTHSYQFSAYIALQGENANDEPNQVDTELRVHFDGEPRATLFMDKGQRWAYKNKTVLNDSEKFLKADTYSDLGKSLVETVNAKLLEHLPGIEMHSVDDGLASGTNAAPKVPEWHTVLPETGLPIEAKDEIGDGYRWVANRVAAEAVEAVRHHQKMNGGQMYAYMLPAANGNHGRVRFVPDDQDVPAESGWKLINGEGLRIGSMTPEQVISKLSDWLRREPILGDRRAAPAKSAEEAIRKAFDARPDRTDNLVVPLKVAFNGVSQEFLAVGGKLPSLSEQQRGLQSTVQLSRLYAGKLLSDMPREILFQAYSLSGRNVLMDTGLPRKASDEDLKRWAEHGLAVPSLENKHLTPVSGSGPYLGKIVDMKDGKVIQDIGRGQLVAHTEKQFANVPTIGDRLEIRYAADAVASVKNLGREEAPMKRVANSR